MNGATITLTGNLGADPELRFTNSGTPVLSLRVASAYRFKPQGAKDWEEETTWFRLNLWRDLAENAAQSFKKGDRVIVVGRMKMREYENKDGEDAQSWEVEVEEIGASVRFATVQSKRVADDADERDTKRERAAKAERKDRKPSQTRKRYEDDEEPF